MILERGSSWVDVYRRWNEIMAWSEFGLARECVNDCIGENIQYVLKNVFSDAR